MILFVDDERRYMQTHLDELDMCGISLHFESEVDAALKFFDENADRIELLILDVMMSPGQFKDLDTDDGLTTGLYVFDHVRQRKPQLPVMIFTHSTAPVVLTKFKDEKNCWFLQKEGFMPFQFAEEVKKILGQYRELSIGGEDADYSTHDFAN